MVRTGKNSNLVNKLRNRRAGSHFDITISIGISIRKICVNRGYIGYISITIRMTIAQAQFTPQESNMAVYVFLSADSADEKTLMLMFTLVLLYVRFTLKYSQQKHEKMKKVPFLVLMLMLL